MILSRRTFAAVLAVAAMSFGCTAEPEPLHAQHIGAVEPLPFHTPAMAQFKAVDAGTTYMRTLLEHVPIEATAPAGVRAEHEHWIVDEGKAPSEDIYLSAPTRAELEAFIASVPSLTLPPGREIAFGRIDDSDRWRTYVVSSTAALDGDDIAHVELTRDAASNRLTAFIDFTHDGSRQFADVTKHMVGERLAVLVDGSVVAAPVIMGPITGGRAQITFAR